MLGGIYSTQKCPICGRKFKDDGKKGLVCEKHPDQRATKLFVRFKDGVFKRFTEYEKAQRFITGLRYKYDEGSFDSRDYRIDEPLGFTNLSEKWLEIRKKDGLKCWNNKRLHIRIAQSFFANKNVKNIGFGELEDFKHSMSDDWSTKYRYDIMMEVQGFLKWFEKRERQSGYEIPKFPEMKYQLGWRKIVDKKTQTEILEEIRRITEEINPKIYIGCLWLSTYVNVRPRELLAVKEADFDLENGILYIRNNKEGKDDKKVYLLEEDIETVKELRSKYPTMLHPEKTFFFRHHKKRKGVTRKKNYKFGRDYLSHWWLEACKNLGVEGVTLYPGTRHSSVVDLGDHYSPEEVMSDGTGHSTTKAFRRYFKLNAGKKRAISARARGKAEVIKKSACTKIAPKN